MDTAELLQRARSVLMMTQPGMAGAMGVSPRTLQALETGQNPTKRYHLAAAAHVVDAAKLVLEVASIPPSPGDVHRTNRMRDLLTGRGYGTPVVNAVLGALLWSPYLNTSDAGDSFALRSPAGNMKLQDLRAWSREATGQERASPDPEPCTVFVIGPSGIESQLLFETVDEALPTIRELRRSDIDIRVAWPRSDNDDAILAELHQLGAVSRT